MFWGFYNLLFLAVYLLLVPRFLLRMGKRGGYRANFGQRFGNFDATLKARFARPGPRVWIHAVSVGEVGVARLLMDRWREEVPGLRFVVSVTTSTGDQVARKALSDADDVIYFPVDLPWIMRRVFRRIQPDAVVLIEQEYWPNLLRTCRRNRVPTAVVNGRVSDRSFPRYMKVRFLTRRVLPLLDRFFMQCPQDAERITAMGAPADRVTVIPSLKYQVRPPDPDAVATVRADLDALGWRNADILLGASIWPGEWEALVEAILPLREAHPTLRLILVPRHAERRAEITAALESAAVTFALRSADTPSKGTDPLAYIADTTGELMAFLAAADIVFIGKSLTQKGGQNPIEAARCGKAILTGPNMRNFPGVMTDFRRADAVLEIDSVEALRETVAELLNDPDRRAALGSRAEALVEANQDVVLRTVTALTKVAECVSPQPMVTRKR